MNDARGLACRGRVRGDPLLCDGVVMRVASLDDLMAHELQAHQSELQLQNAELRRAQVALEKSRGRYVDLYDFAPVAYLTLTREATISDINPTGAALLAVERRKPLRQRRIG